MPYIYRVENKLGDGCYHAQNNPSELLVLLCTHNFSDRHPAPLLDKGIERHAHYNEICGFKDKEQVNNWFKLEELSILETYGFYLKKIKVSKITAVGEKQVLAIRY